MKNTILTSAVLVALTSSTAMAANNDSGNFKVKAKAVDTCVLASPVLEGAILLVTADSATAIAENGADQTIEFADSYCNFPHTIELSTKNNGMTYAGDVEVVGGDFVETVQYTAAVTGWSDDFVLETENGSDSVDKDVNGAFRNEGGVDALTVTLNSLATEDPMLSGLYRDTLTVKLIPTI